MQLQLSVTEVIS